MNKDRIEKTSIDGCFIIKSTPFEDKRGFFNEIARISEFEKFGIDFKPVQFNHSYSLPKVIRAIHCEDWKKLIYPVTGKMFAAIADVRPNSPTFKVVEHFIFDMGIPNERKALFLPSGIGNSICVIGNEPVHYIYCCEGYWSSDKARGIAWNDPDLNIKWPIKNPIISERDKKNPRLRDLYPEKFK